MRHTLWLLPLLLAPAHSAEGNSGGSTDAANAEANTQSLWVLNNLPRYEGVDELSKEEIDGMTDSPQDSKWLKGIAGLFAFCLIVPGLSLLICPFWCACRCCRCCCCKRTEPKNLLEVNEMRFYWAPFGFIVLTTLVMVVFSGLAYSANGEFSDVLLYRNHENLQADDQDRNLWDIVLKVLSDGAGVVSNIGGEVDSLKPTISNAITQVNVILDGTDVIADGTGVLTTMLNNVSDTWADYSITEQYVSNLTGFARTIEFDCAFCGEIAGACSDAALEIDTQTGPIFDDLDSTISSVRSELTNQNDTIMDGIDGFADEIRSVEELLHDFADDINSYRSDVEMQNERRELAYNVLFAVPLVPMIFVILGGVLKMALCFTVGYALLWLSLVIMFFLLALHLPIAAVMSDTCHFLDEVDDNVTQYYDNFQGRTFQGCLSDERLVDILGLGDELDFTKSIEFPTLGNVTDDFAFGALTQFDQDAQAIDYSTFYGAGDSALDAINGLIADCRETINVTTPVLGVPVTVVVYTYAPCGVNKADRFTRDNFTDIDPGLYYNRTSDIELMQQAWEGMANLTDVLFIEAVSISAFTGIADDIAADIAEVTVQAERIENDTQMVVGRVDDAAQLLDPVFVITDNIIDQARCGFIGTGYRSIHHVLCEDVMGVIARIVVAMMVVAVLSLVACCCSIKMVRRAYWLKQRERLRKERDLEEMKAENTGADNAKMADIYAEPKKKSDVGAAHVGKAEKKTYKRVPVSAKQVSYEFQI